MYNVQIKHKTPTGTVDINPKSTDSNISTSSTNEHLPSGIKTVGDVIDAFGALAFEDSIDIPDASTTTSGVVMLSNTIDDTTIENKAATTKAVSTVNESAVHLTGDETINGKKIFNEPVVINGNFRVNTTKDEETGEITVHFVASTDETTES